MSTPLVERNTHTSAKKHTVYVVSFAPSDEVHSSGGFLWSVHKSEAEKLYVHEFKESVRFNNSHIVRLLAVDIDTDISPLSELGEDDRQELLDTVTDELEYRLDELELTACALRQYVPSRTEKDRVPASRER